MNKPLKISLDLDGVLCDFEHAAVDLVRELYVPSLPDGYRMQTWSFSEHITDAQFGVVFKELLRRNVWSTLPAFEESVGALKQVLAFADIELHYITSRPPTPCGPAHTSTSIWLGRRGLPTANLHVVTSPAEKAAIITELGIEYSLDDYFPTVEQCNTLEGHTAYLLRKPYNEDVWTVPVVDTVGEFLWEVLTSERT